MSKGEIGAAERLLARKNGATLYEVAERLEVGYATARRLVIAARAKKVGTRPIGRGRPQTVYKVAAR